MQELIEIIKIGGPATAIASIFVWYLDRLDKRNTSLIENHFNHITDALNKNTVVLERLSTLLDTFLKKKKV